MGCCGFPTATAGSLGASQPGITVARTTSFNLDGTAQNPTFDTVIESDPTGNFNFTPGTDVITISQSGSYRLSVYFAVRNASALTFKVSLENNGLEIPNIFLPGEEGTDQAGIDEYPYCVSLEKITLAAGTVKIIVQEVTRSGAGTNSLQPNVVWSMAQNSGVAGANGADAPGAFTRDEFLVFRASDSGSFNCSVNAKNAFKNNAQTVSDMSILFDAGGIVDTANAKIVLSVGTWELSFHVKATNVTSNAFVNGLITEDPDGTPVNYAAGTQTESGGSSAVNGSTVNCLIKSDGTREITGFVFSNDSDIDVFGGSSPVRTYLSGHRINTDPT